MAHVFLSPIQGKQEKIEIALRYFADPGYQNGVSEVVGVSQPTVSRTINDVVDAICRQASDWIVFPSTHQAVVL